jgi:hypothetical protein
MDTNVQVTVVSATGHNRAPINFSAILVVLVAVVIIIVILRRKKEKKGANI